MKKYIQKIINTNIRTVWLIRYWFFHLFNRTKYGSYYLHLVQNIERHPTLSGKTFDPSEYERKSKIIFEKLRKLGLMNCRLAGDVGCGSLRIGRKVIEEVGVHRYVALDIVDTFFNRGMSEIGISQVEFVHLDSDLGTIFRDRKCDFIFSIGVLFHIPKRDIESYFQKIANLADFQAVVIIECLISDRQQIVSDCSFSYPKEFLVAAAKQVGICDVVFQPHGDYEWLIGKFVSSH
jgi:cyclopropane fatty-acyl-phospholipid synthase-like methyltransferase